MLTNKETEILELYILGLASDEQIKIVEDRLSSDIDYKNEYENLLALKQALRLHDQYKEKKEYLKSLNKEKVTLQSLTTNYKRIFAVAASIVLIISISYIIKTDVTETEIIYGAPSLIDTLTTDSLKNDTMKDDLENPFHYNKTN
tara:strand:- start:1829 stop:2263 length:435 start_codon:yes stop_codon:yes gene_type:complete